ncbi:methyl-accepting chemotaxis protein [Bacillus suaedae]|uniref:Methyl-accepting chemotaxis protein n=1 Tax=Halalkalibacter suaedae TaxID=2822140 RepID=A0A941API4_9BACI|nr:methyl-accepting chemotaxis protein [Bacillus suaedae]MBP3951836.1 methyl-accepting chemotaxis protein [Bacillus suaedae]
MLRWNNMKLGTKYSLSLIATIILFVVSTAIISILLLQINSGIDTLERRGDRSVTLTEMGSQFRSKDTRIADFITYKDQALIQEFEDKREDFNKLETDVNSEMDTDEQRKLFNQVIENDKIVNDLFLDGIVPAVNNGDIEQALELRATTIELRSETDDLLDELRGIVNKEREISANLAKDDASYTFIVLLIALVISIVSGAIITYFVNRRIQNQLKKVVYISDQIANGNLSVEKVDYYGKDEIGQLASSINAMRDNLKNVIKEITDVSLDVNSQSEELTQVSNQGSLGADQIAATMEQLSAGAEEQSSSSLEISHLINSLNSQILNTRDEGELLQKSSKQVIALSNSGKDNMEQSVHLMTEINHVVSQSVKNVKGLDHKAQDISKLVKVIEEIAEQTNLLALNAAIEAARAGEHGKGFAVVADEVRKLAEQVSDSISEITGIIQGIQTESNLVVTSLESGFEKVNEGNKQIGISRESFTSINNELLNMLTGIEKVTANLEDISTNSEKVRVSSEEIAESAEEAAAGIEQSTATAQQQSSSMQEISSSAESLASYSDKLQHIVRTFKI